MWLKYPPRRPPYPVRQRQNRNPRKLASLAGPLDPLELSTKVTFCYFPGHRASSWPVSTPCSPSMSSFIPRVMRNTAPRMARRRCGCSVDTSALIVPMPCLL